MLSTKIESFTDNMTMGKVLLFGAYLLYLVALPLSILITPFGQLSARESDFLAYYSAGKMVNSRRANLIYDTKELYTYQAEYRRGTRPFLNLPIVVLPFIFLSKLPLSTAYVLFELLSFTLLTYCIYVLNKMYRFTDLRKFLLLTLPSIAIVLGVGQISMIILLSVTLTYFFQKRGKEFLAGIFLGLIIIKFQFLLLVPFVLILSKDRLKLLFGLILTASSLVIASFLLYGGNFIGAYFKMFKNLGGYFWEGTNNHGISIVSLSFMVPSNKLLYSIAFLIFLCVSVYLYSSQKTKGYDQLYLTALIGSIVLAPYALIYDAVLLLPLVSRVLSKDNFYKDWSFYVLHLGIVAFQFIGLSWMSTILLCAVAFSINRRGF